MIGFSEAAKVSAIAKVFYDAYKSPLSLIVVDSIERLLDYVAIGPRFSNSVLQCLLTVFKKAPPPGRRLLVIATTNNRSLLGEMEMSDCFTSEIHVPPITSLESLEYVVMHGDNSLLPEDRAGVVQSVSESISDGERHFLIGIKKLLALLEMAAQDSENAVLKFMEAFESCLFLK